MDQINEPTMENICLEKVETVKTEKDAHKRPNWSNSLEFLMSCISVSVGLGNVWRFPFIAYENGGGAFLIPYLIVLFTIGKPMYYFEMILGQFASKGSIKIWSICPSFLGIGYGQAIGAICIITYYSSLLALTLFYFAMSFQSILPWSYCQPEWGENCVNSTMHEGSTEIVNQTKKLQSSSELYFLKEVTEEKNDISDGIGIPIWKLAISLFVSWIIIFLVISRGVKSSGKAAYFLALFPYIVLIALLIRAVTLEGAVDGILFFLKPNWNELLNFNVWKEAVVQCFFSLAVGLGPIIMFASYNRFDHGIYRDVMIVTSLDTCTSMLAGITIFGILGNLAHNLKITDIKEVVRNGASLAFISYPDAIAKFQAVPQLFAVLFFFMLFVLGVGSIVALQSVIATIVCDQFKTLKYWKVALLTSTCGFLLSLVYVTPGGQWILNLVDFYGGTYLVFVLAIFEVVGVSWIYGVSNFCEDVEFMTNKKVSFYWRFCWAFVTPVLMIVIFIYSMVQIQPLLFGEKVFPDAGYVAGWLLLAIGFLQFPLWGVWYISYHYNGYFKESLLSSLKADSKWAPSKEEDKLRWIAYKKDLAERKSKREKNSKLNSLKEKLCSFYSS